MNFLKEIFQHLWHNDDYCKNVLLVFLAFLIKNNRGSVNVAIFWGFKSTFVNSSLEILLLVVTLSWQWFKTVCVYTEKVTFFKTKIMLTLMLLRFCGCTIDTMSIWPNSLPLCLTVTQIFFFFLRRELSFFCGNQHLMLSVETRIFF